MSRRSFLRLALGAAPAVLAVAGCSGSNNAVESPAKFSPRPTAPPTAGGATKKEPPNSKID